jgi:uncharacterized protein (TIGR00375 family)
MIQIDCDFHIHSRFSAGTSRTMDLEKISSGAGQKGLNLLATGDALQKTWLEEIESLSFHRGVGRLNECYFILTTEVEDKNRVHHLIIFKDIPSIHDLRRVFSKHSADIDIEGRPHIRLGGREIAKAAHSVDAIVGPSHAFVPWTSVYKEFDSLGECYGSEGVDFLELGLSADTYLANEIEELTDIAFLSNSDAHSASPNRLGREFNRLKVEKISFDEVKKAILGINGREIVLNVGLDPRLGKYHRTSCIKCYTHYLLDEAVSSRWRCPRCGGLIKKGVFERISELRNSGGVKRPRYLRIAPLAEIIAKVLGYSSVQSKSVQRVWSSIIGAFESEIAVLVDVPIEKIREIHAPTAKAIKLYREDKFSIIEGGGGKYGEIVFKEFKKSATDRQVNLDLF